MMKPPWLLLDLHRLVFFQFNMQHILKSMRWQDDHREDFIAKGISTLANENKVFAELLLNEYLPFCLIFASKTEITKSDLNCSWNGSNMSWVKASCVSVPTKAFHIYCSSSSPLFSPVLWIFSMPGKCKTWRLRKAGCQKKACGRRVDVDICFQSKKCKCVSASGSSWGSLWWNSYAPGCSHICLDPSVLENDCKRALN